MDPNDNADQDADWPSKVADLSSGDEDTFQLHDVEDDDDTDIDEDLLRGSPPDARNVRSAWISLVVILTMYHWMGRLWWMTGALLAIGVWRYWLARREIERDEDRQRAHQLVRSVFYWPTMVGLAPVLAALLIRETL